MKRPLIPVALYYTGGLLLAEAVQPPLVVLFASCFVLLGIAVFAARTRTYLLGPMLILLGWTNLVQQTAILSPFDLRHQLKTEPALVTVRGVLTETPSLRIHERDGQELMRTLVPLQVTTLATNEQWQPATGLVLISTKGELPADFFAGREVEVNGVIAPPPTPLAKGLFDYRTYLARQGIYYQLKTDSTHWRTIDSRTNAPFADRFLGWAKQTLARGLPEQDEPLRLLWAMTLGWKTALTGEVNEPFMKSGTINVFSFAQMASQPRNCLKSQ